MGNGSSFKNVHEYATWLAGKVGLGPAPDVVALDDIEKYVKFINTDKIVPVTLLACKDHQVYLTDSSIESAQASTINDIKKDFTRSGTQGIEEVPLYVNEQKTTLKENADNSFSQQNFSDWHLENYGQHWLRPFSEIGKAMGNHGKTLELAKQVSSPDLRNSKIILEDEAEDSKDNHYSIPTKTAAMGLYEQEGRKYVVVIEKDLTLATDPGDPENKKAKPIPGHMISVYRYVEEQGYVFESMKGSNPFPRVFMAQHKHMVDVAQVKYLRKKIINYVLNAQCQRYQRYCDPRSSQHSNNTAGTILAILLALRILAEKIDAYECNAVIQIIKEAEKSSPDLYTIGIHINALMPEITSLQAAAKKQMWKGAAWLVLGLALLTFSALAGLEFVDTYKAGLAIESWVVNDRNNLGAVAAVASTAGGVVSAYQAYVNIRPGYQAKQAAQTLKDKKADPPDPA